MLDPAHIPRPAKIDEIRQLAAEYSGHLLDAEAVGDVCRRFIHRLDPDAHYDVELDVPSGVNPQGSFAPAVAAVVVAPPDSRSRSAWVKP